MDWKQIEKKIRENIITGIKFDNRIVLEGPDFPCYRYDYNVAKGYLVKFGPI